MTDKRGYLGKQLFRKRN